MHLVKSTRLCLAAILLVLMGSWSLAGVQSVFAWGGPKDLPLGGVPCGGTNCQIFSVRLAAEGNRVHLIYGQKDSKQLFYNRGTTAADGTVTWERARVLAKNVTVLNIAAWDIAADPNGTIHVVYYSSGGIYYIKNIQHGDIGNWSSSETIDSGSSRAYGMSIKLDTEGTPYVAWTAGINRGSARFAYRQNNGSWNVRSINLKAYFLRIADLAVVGSGGSATVHLLYELQKKQEDQNYTISYVRGTRAGNLDSSDFSGGLSGSSCSCERPRIAVDPSTNALYAGFVGGSKEKGFFWAFTRSQDNGLHWSPITRLRAGASNLWADDTPMVAANNTVYLDLPVKKYVGSYFSGWGSIDVRYNAVDNTFRSPAAILNYEDTNGKLDRSIDYAINQIAKVAVWIRNFTDGPGYSSDPGGIDVEASGQLAINNGASSTNSATVTITITNLIGNPTQMRVALDTPMSDAIPLEPFQASFTRTFTNLNTCDHTVAVTLVNDSGISSRTPLQAKITVDAAVQASVLVGNPYKRSNAVVFSQTQNSTQTVDDGDSQYTRVPAFYAEVNGGAECSSLKQVSIGQTADTYNSTVPIASNFYASTVFIPGAVVVGPNTIVLQVDDNAGNSQVYSRTISYDPTPPTLVTSGTLTVQVPRSGPSILTTLVFSGNLVTDNMYPNGFWGMWIANSRTAVTNPISDTNLVWSTVQRPDTNANFSLQNWSVLSGIPTANQTAGDYYVYVRFLDGAGNPTNEVLTSTVTLNQITKPTVTLPVVIR